MLNLPRVSCYKLKCSAKWKCTDWVWERQNESKTDTNYWTQYLAAFWGISARTFLPPLPWVGKPSQAANKPVMMMPIWTQSFPQIIGAKIQPDLEKTTVQKETKSLQRRISSLTLFGKMFFFSMFVSLSKIKLGKTLQMKNGSSSLSSSSSSFQ